MPNYHLRCLPEQQAKDSAARSARAYLAWPAPSAPSCCNRDLVFWEHSEAAFRGGFSCFYSIGVEIRPFHNLT
jgi:hypothetical protein